MTRKQKLAKNRRRRSEISARLHDMGRLTAEQRTEEIETEERGLEDECATLDREHVQLLDAADDPSIADPNDTTGEGDEIRALQVRSRVAAFVAEVANGSAIAETEPEAELRAALLGGNIGGAMPLAMLDPARVRPRAANGQRAAVESRADAFTQLAADVDVGAMQGSIQGRVFARSAAAWLGVMFGAPDMGDAVYPVLKAGATAERAERGTMVDADAATFAAEAINPGALRARVGFSIEDAARLAGMEEALTMDLNGALQEQLDNQVLNGDGTGANFSGLLQELDDPAAPGTATTWQGYVAGLIAGADGRYAVDNSELRLLVNADTWGHAGALTVGDGAVSAVEYLRQISGGVRVSALMPAAVGANNVSQAIRSAYMHVGAVVAVWPSVRMTIRDEVTRAGEGRVMLTANMLAGMAVTREATFAQLAFRAA